MERIACGQVGLEVSYFYSLTPRQFANILDGYNEKTEAQMRRQYEMTRMIMYASLVPWQKITPEEILKFPWEQQKKQAQPKQKKYKTKAELQKLFADK